MSTMDPQYARQNMPAAIEAIEEEHLKKMPATAETLKDIAKQLDVPQVTEDIEAFGKIVEANAEVIKKFCGQEGDRATDSGSLWSVVSAAETLIKATGGEL